MVPHQTNFQTLKQDSFSKKIEPRDFMVAGSPQTIWIGDVPRETSLVQLYEQIRKLTGIK